MFSVIVPVKRLAGAKSRLAVEESLRQHLVLAFALDTTAAALDAARVASVTVVTDEPSVAAAVSTLGCQVVPDEGAGDLNDALRAGVRRLPAGPVAALCGDLPSLRSRDLDDVLAGVGELGFVPDAEGTGTTLLAASRPLGFEPRFGPGSRQAHLGAGAVEVGLGLATVRRDVDVLEDLLLARELGVGRHTAVVLGRCQLAGA